MVKTYTFYYFARYQLFIYAFFNLHMIDYCHAYVPYAHVPVNTSVSTTTNFEIIKVNFQSDDAETPAGFLADKGEVFGDRNNGYQYGWDRNNSHNAISLKRSSNELQVGTFIHMRRNGLYTWEIAIPNGVYEVNILMGDESCNNQLNHIKIEDTEIQDVDGRDYFDQINAVVEVRDGKLTLASLSGSIKPKINYIEISTTDIVLSEGPSIEKDEVVGDVLLYPNPAIDQLNISLEGNYKGKIEAHIFQIDGKMIDRQEITKVSAESHFSVKVNQLSMGNYIIQLQVGEHTINRKFMVIR